MVKLITPVQYADPLALANEPRPLTLARAAAYGLDIPIVNAQGTELPDKVRGRLLDGDDRGACGNFAAEQDKLVVEDQTFTIPIDQQYKDVVFANPFYGFYIKWTGVHPSDRLYWCTPGHTVIDMLTPEENWHYFPVRGTKLSFMAAVTVLVHIDALLYGLTI